jgi:hypothetical protein
MVEHVLIRTPVCFENVVNVSLLNNFLTGYWVTQHLIQWIPGFFLWRQSGQCVKLTIHLHLRMCGIKPPLPIRLRGVVVIVALDISLHLLYKTSE